MGQYSHFRGLLLSEHHVFLPVLEIPVPPKKKNFPQVNRINSEQPNIPQTANINTCTQINIQFQFFGFVQKWKSFTCRASISFCLNKAGFSLSGA